MYSRCENFNGKIRVYNPAGVNNVVDFLRARDGGLVLPPALLGAYLAQSADSGSYAYRVDGIDDPVAMAGVWHHEGCSYVWLMTRGEVVPHMVSFCKAMRRNLDHELQLAPSGRVRMTVVPGHGPGERLARLMGLKPRYIEAGYRIWERVRNGRGDYTIVDSWPKRGLNDLFDAAGKPIRQESSQSGE